MLTRSDLLALRSRYAGLASSVYKQMGLRHIREALAFLGRNDAYAAKMAEHAAHWLPYAEAKHEAFQPNSREIPR